MSNTVRFHRVLRAEPQKVYRAFLDTDAMAKWLPPNGFTGKVHHMDAKVGGTYKMSFTNFTSGRSHAFGGEYLELVPHERIRYTDRFDDPNLPGEMQTTVTLKRVSCGTELNIVQEGLPAVIPPEACYLGWQESLTLSGEARRGRDPRLAPAQAHDDVALSPCSSVGSGAWWPPSPVATTWSIGSVGNWRSRHRCRPPSRGRTRVTP